MQNRINYISKWIKSYAEQYNKESLVVGISGGIDSSVVSALCASTGMKTFAVTMPIRQKPEQDDLSMLHGDWLKQQYNTYHNTVAHCKFDLTFQFEEFERMMGDQDKHGLANTRARMRMMTLYQLASMHNGIVVGTGNKVEDFGVGFYTKYGDGGVDISPIGDCMKSEVYAMARVLGIHPQIIAAAPTDGLWDDGRTDEGQLGMTYDQLEECMIMDEEGVAPYDGEQITRLEKFKEIQSANKHKMDPIPVCMVGDVTE